MLGLIPPTDADWNLLVVDNGSQDHTQRVIAQYSSRLKLRSVIEPRAGLSNARNCGVAAAAGDYLVWTDDDVTVDPGWLQAYVEAFRRWPDAALFGGTIIPELEPPTPPWIAESVPVLGGMLALRDFGDMALPLNVVAGLLPFGANYAIRLQDQRRFPYDPSLGYAPGQRRMDEETQMFVQLLGSGAHGIWVPRARVTHRISPQRQNMAYILRYYMTHGETQAALEPRRPVPFLFGAPRWLWRRAIGRYLGYCLHRQISPAPIWLQHYTAYANDRGAIAYWRRTERAA